MRCTKAYRLSYTDKAKQIVDRLTLEEKVKLMSGIGYYFGNPSVNTNKHYNYLPFYSGGLEDKKIPPMLFCDGPRGVVLGSGNTCFPVTMLRGATFDVDLEERIGQAIAREVKAYGCNLFAGVCINLPYHPGWGRSQETYGEDSYHIGQMGSALVKGVQGENVMACAKHFAFNSMELSRYQVNVECDKRTEREVFLPHFKECIDNGAVVIMSAYNRYQGSYCSQDEYLLTKVLKEEWDFDGFIFSDFNQGIKDTVTAANSGQDMEMCNIIHYGDKLVQAVREGKVPEEKINDSALRIVRTILSFTEADDKQYDKSVLSCKAHISLALEAARKGITLLKNKDKTLPFRKDKSLQIAVFGRLANKENIGDHGSSNVYPDYIVTPLQGIAKLNKHAQVIFHQGTNLEHAKRLAANADYCIFVVGYNYDDEGEHIEGEDLGEFAGLLGGDRIHSLGLHQDEIELIKTVGPVNSNSAAVLIGGNMILMEEWQEYVNAIVMAYYPGMEGGTAIAEILFGDVNPSGKLPFVITKKESDLPQINWETTRQRYEYYHGYRKLEKEKIEPSLPYGFGLSYTTFEVSEAQFWLEDDYLISSCLVKNTGGRDGDEVIQLYVGYQNSKLDRSIKELKGFQRVSLKMGEQKKVMIKTPFEKLCWFNEKKHCFELEHMEYEVSMGTSSATRDLIQSSIVI